MTFVDEGLVHFNKSVLSRLALCYITLSSTLQEPLLNLSVSSVRSHGEWDGPIYVITDQPNCIPKTTRAIFVDLNGCQKKMAFKLFKTLVLDLVPSDYILYLDTDIMIAKPLRGLANMSAIAGLAGPESELAPNFVGVTQDMIMSERQNNIRKYPTILRWHGGIALVSRERSHKCLQKWRSEFYQCTRDGDQLALKHAIESGDCIFADMDSLFSWPTHTNILKRDFAVFNHFTRTGRLRLKHGLYKEDLNFAGRLLFGKQLPDQWWLKNDETCILDSSLYAPRRPEYVLSNHTCQSLPPFDKNTTSTKVRSARSSVNVNLSTRNFLTSSSRSTKRPRPSLSYLTKEKKVSMLPSEAKSKNELNPSQHRFQAQPLINPTSHVGSGMRPHHRYRRHRPQVAQ